MGFLDDQIQAIETRKRRRTLIVPIFIILFFITLIIGGMLLHSYTHGKSVTVVVMEGELFTGDFSGSGFTGSERIGRNLIGAADDPLVEAIVLRVNSPGGTPAAAQEIIEDLKYARARKPVVVSIGDMATSAAYYVCAYADRIYANPDSITGGIGTVWIFYDISRWMEKEGYAVTVIKSGDQKDMTYPYRPLSSEEETYARDVVNRSFERFVTDITGQRNITRDVVETGRLFRGEEGRNIGLVDELGNLNAAIEGARTLARQR